MMTNTDLATTNGGGTTLAALDDPYRLAETFVKSGYFQDAKQAPMAVVKILAGRELGFGPMASMTGVHVIKGKVSLSSNLMAAAIKRSGRYDYRATFGDDCCSITFLEAGHVIGESMFSIADAQVAGLMGNDSWKKYARNMLFARALSNGAKWFCPDIFGGPIYTPEELGAEVDGETGDPIHRPNYGGVHDALPADIEDKHHASGPPDDSEATSTVIDHEPKPAVEQPESWKDEIALLAEAGDMRAFCEAWSRINYLEDDYRRTGTIKLWAKAVTDISGPDELTKMRSFLEARGTTESAIAIDVMSSALEKLDQLEGSESEEEAA